MIRVEQAVKGAILQAVITSLFVPEPPPRQECGRYTFRGDVVIPDKLFESFFMGGFECSTHYTRERRRVDVLEATQHDANAASDYRHLRGLGISTVREGLRWHLIEKTPGVYDFSSALPLVHAARESGTQVIWDLCHYGWPDFVNVYRPEFARRFAGLATAFTELLVNETNSIPYICPINEVSFFSWAGGEVGYFNPHSNERGLELKAQLVRASIEGIESIWAANPKARICHIDPIIHVVPRTAELDEIIEAEQVRESQFEAWDMIAGRQWPMLGGDEKYLDIIGVNYYYDNQWINKGPRIFRGMPGYRPLRGILHEVYERYKRPMFIAETGIEGDARPEWLAFVAGEVRAAIKSGVDLRGICLYPVLNHPGWDDNRHCHNGLLDYADDTSIRQVFEPLAREIRLQTFLMENMSVQNYSPAMNGDSRNPVHKEAVI